LGGKKDVDCFGDWRFSNYGNQFSIFEASQWLLVIYHFSFRFVGQFISFWQIFAKQPESIHSKINKMKKKMLGYFSF
jgi:hypothetical protein